MNYSESHQILEEVKAAKKILVNLHRGPDPDSFSSAFALYYFLKSEGKDVDVVLTNTSELSSQLLNMEEASLVKFVDYKKFDFKKYDLFITPDSGSWMQIVDNEEVEIPDIRIVVIDHHESNKKFGRINLIDTEAASCAQVIYLFFKDLDFYVDTKMANLLMKGIISDTGGFAFTNDPVVMEVAAELIRLGANKEKIINDEIRSETFTQLKVEALFLSRMNLDKQYKFVWSAVSHEDIVKLKIPKKSSSIVATKYASSIKGTNFGIIMYEEEESDLNISIRSRSDIDVSKLAELLNGGGHKKAAGGNIKGMPFKKAVEKVLEIARRYAKENS